MIYFIALFVTILSAAAAQLSIKKGVSQLGQLTFSFGGILKLIIQLIKNFYIILGLFLLGIAFLIWIFVISKKQLNVAYPVSASLSIILVTFFSWILFREQLSPYQIGGVIFIISGIFLLLKP